MHRRPCGPYAWRTWRVCPWERERGGDSRGGSMMRAGGPCTQPGRVGARADTWPSRALPAARCVMRSGRVHGDQPSLQKGRVGSGPRLAEGKPASVERVSTTGAPLRGPVRSALSPPRAAFKVVHPNYTPGR